MSEEKQMSAIEAYNASLTPEQRKEAASRAGKASVAAKRVYKSQREVLKQLLTIDVTDPQKVQALKVLGFEPTFANAIGLAALEKSAGGDIEAARFVRDTVGEKPTEAYNLGISNAPIKALDLGKLTDQELEALADRADEE